MPDLTLQQAFDLAAQNHQAGRFKEAESMYRQILSVDPRHFDALHYMGLLAHQLGRNDVAIQLVQQAISIKGDFPQAYNNLGVFLEAAGKPDQAIAAFRKALFFNPQDATTHHNLGNALRQMGCMDEAIATYRQAILIKHDYAEAHRNLGNALGCLGDLAGAASACLQALSFQPDYPEALIDLGTAYREMGRIDEAIMAFGKVTAIHPDNAQAHNNLAITMRQAGRLDEAISSHQRTIEISPEWASAHNELGITFYEKGQLDESFHAYQRAISLRPDFAEALSNLGILFDETGKLDEAIVMHRRAASIRPDYFPAHNNLGNALRQHGQLDGALEAYRRALALKPGSSEVILNSGNAMKDMGMIEEAMANYSKAHALMPDSPAIHSNLLYAMNFLSQSESCTIAEKHFHWNKQHGSSLRKFIVTHTNEKNPNRRLRVGYVSPDFQSHSVAYFLESLLEHHDPAQVEVYCYSHVLHPDAVTHRLQNLATHWRRIIGRSDSEVADLIRADGIDILVDLAGHTANNRLPVFARKPAPVQVTWLGYPNTTGLDTIDFRISDAFADPPSTTDHLHSETLVRLPRSAWCYRPLENAPAVSDLPAIESAAITFGSFNAMPKINPPLIDLWAKILHVVPDSRLLLKNNSLSELSVQKRLKKQFVQAGVSEERLIMTERIPDPVAHLATYARVDITLDTFPYHGTTTTCESLWMGVPVVTLAGETHVSRVGVSLLHHLGHAEWIAGNPDEYVKIAAALANDIPRLTKIRSSLREKIQTSPLMDAVGFSREIESAYRKMWHDWCGRSES